MCDHFAKETKYRARIYAIRFESTRLEAKEWTRVLVLRGDHPVGSRHEMKETRCVLLVVGTVRCWGAWDACRIKHVCVAGGGDRAMMGSMRCMEEREGFPTGFH